jgi:hypothetical protein
VVIKLGGDGGTYDQKALEEAFNPASETNLVFRP